MKGKAYLVGAGPGRADLISVRGLAFLRVADVVIYDRLIAQELLDEVRPQAERIFVGKQGFGPRTIQQEDINALLVERVKAGLQVVRLKGGDGFVFGRGGEECVALAAAGLPFEVVPGISAAVAAPAYAGIPVTHRGQANSFTVVAGFEDPTREGSNTAWSAVANVPTVVVLMGVRSAAKICDALVAHGRDAPRWPVCHKRWNRPGYLPRPYSCSEMSSNYTTRSPGLCPKKAGEASSPSESRNIKLRR